MSEINVRVAGLEDKPLLRALAEFYLYDFSEFTAEDLDAAGRFAYEGFDGYWTEPGRTPYLVSVDGHPAGFAFVHQHLSLRDGAPVTDMAEFFVMRKYRRTHVGETLAGAVFDRHPGPWQVRELAKNLPAQAFWRTIIGRYTGGGFDEQTFDDDRHRGPVQYFESTTRASADGGQQ